MSEIREDEGFIDIRFVLGRDNDPVAPPYIMRVERIGYALPTGTTAQHLDYAVAEFWDDPHSLVEDVVTAFEHFPETAFDE